MFIQRLVMKIGQSLFKLPAHMSLSLFKYAYVSILLGAIGYVFPSFLKGCWLVDCLGLNDPLRQYFGLYRAISQREGERIEK